VKKKSKARKSLCVSAAHNIKKRYSIVFENKVQSSIKDRIKLFEQQINSSILMIKNDLNTQEDNFKNKFKTIKHKLVIGNDRTQSFSVDNNIVRRKLSSNKKPRTRTKSSENVNKQANYFQSYLSDRKYSGSKVKPINDVFLNFLHKFHVLFIERIFENSFNEGLSIVNRSFDVNVNLYKKTEDYIKEMELTFGDDLKDIYQKSVNLMIDTVILEKEKEELKNHLLLKKELTDLYKKMHITHKFGDQILSTVILELVENLINLIKY